MTSPQVFAKRLFPDGNIWFWMYTGLFFLVIFLAFKARWALAMGYAPDLGGFERNVIWAVGQILEGKPLYQDPHTGSHALIQYQPIYYQWLAFWARLFHIEATDARSIYQIARVSNILLGIATSSIFYQTLRKGFRISPASAFFFALVPLLTLDSFAISGRSDTLKCFLFSVLVYLATAFPERRIRWHIAWNVSLAILAFFTKQDGLLFGLAMPLAWFWLGRWKSFLLQSFCLIALAAGGTLLLQITTDGAYLANVMGGLKNGISLNWFAQVFYGFFDGRAVFYVPALFFAFEFLREKDQRLVFLAILLMLTFFGNVLLAFKYGSGTNYFTESTILASAMLAIGLQASSIPAFLTEKGRAWCWGTCFLAIYFLSSMLPWAMTGFGNQEVVQKQQFESQKALVARIQTLFPGKEQKGLVLFGRQWEDFSTTLLGSKALFPTRDVWTQVFDAAEGKGFEETAKFLNQKGNVAFLLTDGERIPLFLNLDPEGFQIQEKVGPYFIWVHK